MAQTKNQQVSPYISTGKGKQYLQMELKVVLETLDKEYKLVVTTQNDN